MSLTINPANVTSALFGTGWEDVEPGTFTIDTIELAGTAAPANEDYGFTFVSYGQTVTGRLSALQAVKETDQLTLDA